MSKYLSKKILYKGKTFDSIKELKRYTILEAMESKGIIKDLETQTEIVIFPKSKYGRRIVYKADFTYWKDGKYHVEDVKSDYTSKLPLYRLKKRCVAEICGIEIEEII